MAMPRTLPGPVGVVGARKHVDSLLDRIESDLGTFRDLKPDLDQRERLERALTKAHQDDMDELRRRMR